MKSDKLSSQKAGTESASEKNKLLKYRKKGGEMLKLPAIMKGDRIYAV